MWHAIFIAMYWNLLVFSLSEPNFVKSIEYGDKVYFLFRETAVEYINCGKVCAIFIYSRSCYVNRLIVTACCSWKTQYNILCTVLWGGRDALVQIQFNAAVLLVHGEMKTLLNCLVNGSAVWPHASCMTRIHPFFRHQCIILCTSS